MTKIAQKMVLSLLSIILACVLVIPAAAQEPDINGYIGDKPLTTYSHDTIKGGLTYTVGDSYYSGKLYTDDTYTVQHSVSIPSGAVVKFARLYNYWTWSAAVTTGRYPEMDLSFDGNDVQPEITFDDRKEWGIYDYPTGTWVYDVTGFITGSGSHSVIVKNTGPAGNFFCMDGIGLLIVYTDENGKDIEYWVNEGCDMLNSQIDDDGTPLYYTLPDQTFTEMMAPSICINAVKSATLWTVIQSGNWDANVLIINDMNITGICNAMPHPDLEVDKRDITEYLVDGPNTIQFQAVEDYAVPSGSILVLEIDPDVEGVSVAAEHSADLGESAKPAPSPGFGAAFMIITILITALVILRKHRK